MPTFSFECGDCEREFFSVTKVDQKTARCPHCGGRGSRVLRFYPVSLQIPDDPATTAVTSNEIDRRVGRAAEGLREAYGGVREDRREAQKTLGTRHVTGNPIVGFDRLPDEEVDFRRKVEGVMKREPKERLEKAGVRIIKARTPR